MVRSTIIYCVECGHNVVAELVSGKEIYGNDKFKDIPFWRCPTCGNWVGSHYKSTHNPDAPLGCIPTKEIRAIRRKIHSMIDPLWKSGSKKNQHKKRTEIYSYLSKELLTTYHTGMVDSVEYGEKVIEVLRKRYGEEIDNNVLKEFGYENP